MNEADQPPHVPGTVSGSRATEERLRQTTALPLVKHWWQAKTTWLGFGLTVIGVATYFSDPAHTPALTVASISEAVGGIAAIVLRTWFTNTAIAGTPAAAPQIVEPQ